jgi:hypothetical protein
MISSDDLPGPMSKYSSMNGVGPNIFRYRL